MKRKWLIAAAVMLVGPAIPAASASPHMHIEKCAGARSFKDCSEIRLNGFIAQEDAAEFLERTKEIKSAMVFLEGPGGSLMASIRIGEAIAAKRFDTMVGRDSSCLSACANIWLAGAKRGMMANSSIIFHVPYSDEDPSHADGAGGVLLGMYMAGLGFSYDYASQVFGHDPNQWHMTLSGPDLSRVECSITKAEFDAGMERGWVSQDEKDAHCQTFSQNDGERQ